MKHYILKAQNKNIAPYYVGMIAGQMVKVSQDGTKAKRFETREQAEAELTKYAAFLSKAQFQVVEVPNE